jgi:putative sterol carrier protein
LNCEKPEALFIKGLKMNNNSEYLNSLFLQLEDRLRKNPERTKGIIASYQFDITGDQGGQWHVSINDGYANVKLGRTPTPSCTITMAVFDYIEMATGMLDGQDAFLSGKLKVIGETEYALLAARIFKLP